MGNRAVLLVSLAIVSCTVFGENIELHPEVPFTPIYAADQKDISFSSLFQEYGEFQQFVAHNGLIGVIEMKKLENIKLKQDYDRLKGLLEKGTANVAQFETFEFQYKLGVLRVKELQARAQGSLAALEISRFGVQQEGDRSLDLRREIAQGMKRAADNQLVAFEASGEIGALSVQYLERRLVRARDLFRKNVISKTELKERQLEFLNAKVQVLTTARQVEAMKKSIEGMNRTIKRLFAEP